MVSQEKTIIRFSLDDIIQIFENEPVQPDMVAGITVSRIMNRGPIAHLSIERALKFLIEEAAGAWEKDHNLESQFKNLQKYDPNSAKFLEDCFEAAVKHYRINPASPGSGHFKTLTQYLAETGSETAFNSMRYWELDQSLDENIVRRISLFIHYELLQGLRGIVLDLGRPTDTVKERVERVVEDAIFPRSELAYVIGSEKEDSVNEYQEWLGEFPSNEKALKDAFQKEFHIGSEFVNKTARQAYETLASCPDPAARYLARLISVLPKQQANVSPHIEWLDSQKRNFGRVYTPGGTNLGHIQCGSDGLWNIVPYRDRFRAVSPIARSSTDAMRYLVDKMTSLARVHVGEVEKTERLLELDYRFFRRAIRDDDTGEIMGKSDPITFRAIFWSTEHGLEKGQEVTIVQIGKGNLEEVIEGTVTSISGSEVHGSGHPFWRTKDGGSEDT